MAGGGSDGKYSKPKPKTRRGFLLLKPIGIYLAVMPFGIAGALFHAGLRFHFDVDSATGLRAECGIFAVDMERYATILVMVVFYAAYFTKALLQKKQGVNTMILGKGDKPVRQIRIERSLQITTFMIPIVELASIWWDVMAMPSVVKWIGIAISAIGVACFIAGMTTMRDSWRAGIPEQKETKLVTRGIYRISRNPAFLGFDLIYLGILIAYPNAWHAAIVALAFYLFHQQIKSEEMFLEEAFGQEYLDYKKSVRRYI